MLVYKIFRSGSNKVYIGVTRRTLAARWADHRECALGAKPGKLYAAMRKHGIDAFRMEAIALAETPEDLFRLEQELIAQHNSFHAGYNMTIGGEGPRGLTHSDASREKMRLSHLGKKRTPESIEKAAAKLRGRKFGPKSLETRRKLSLAHKGRKYGPCSESAKRAIGERNRGEGNGMFGRRHSLEARAKISAAPTEAGNAFLRTMSEHIAAAHEAGVISQSRLVVYLNNAGILTRFGKLWNAVSINYLVKRLESLPDTQELALGLRRSGSLKP